MTCKPISNEREEWRDVIGSVGYMISSLGRVYSSHRGGRILVASQSSSGYLTVALNRKTKNVHSLVARAFLSGDGQCNHKDGNKLNNSISNLEIVSASENRMHAVRNLGVGAMMERHHSAKLTCEGVKRIRECYPRISVSQLADELHVSKISIYRVINKDTWKHEHHFRIKPPVVASCQITQ